MNIWQYTTIALYLLGAVVNLRLIYVADFDTNLMVSGYEKVFCFFFWPILAVVGIFLLSNDWLKERDQ